MDRAPSPKQQRGAPHGQEGGSSGKWGSGGGVAFCPPPGSQNEHGRAGKGEEFKGEVCAAAPAHPGGSSNSKVSAYGGREFVQSGPIQGALGRVRGGSNRFFFGGLAEKSGLC